MIVKKMPCLRSQTRASSNDTSTESADLKYSSVVPALATTMSSLGISSKSKSSKPTAFPFPPALIPTKAKTATIPQALITTTVKTPSIIDITNPSSEASLSSDLSLVSVQSTTVSSDDSFDKTENLDTAMLQISRNESSLSRHAEGALPVQESDPDPALVLPSSDYCSSLSSLIRQSVMSSPLVYIPVMEQPAVDKRARHAYHHL